MRSDWIERTIQLRLIQLKKLSAVGTAAAGTVAAAVVDVKGRGGGRRRRREHGCALVAPRDKDLVASASSSDNPVAQ
eukprot:scaffold1699_cov252-Ochromonas_danica.AAC.16